jgi:hypothetical protein
VSRPSSKPPHQGEVLTGGVVGGGFVGGGLVGGGLVGGGLVGGGLVGGGLVGGGVVEWVGEGFVDVCAGGGCLTTVMDLLGAGLWLGDAVGVGLGVRTGVCGAGPGR